MNVSPNNQTTRAITPLHHQSPSPRTREGTMQHTCDQTPNDEDRILPGCSACRETSYGDGLNAGAQGAAENIFELLTNAVKEEFNPMQTARRDDALALWENGRTVLKLMDKVKTRVHAKQVAALHDHIKDTTVLPPSPPDTAAENGP